MELNLVANTIDEVVPVELILDLSNDMIPALDLDLDGVTVYHNPYPDYPGPYIIKAGIDDTWVLPTQNNVMTDDLEVQGARSQETRTTGTSGYTLSID